MTRPILFLGAMLLLLPALLSAQDSAKAKPKPRRMPDLISAAEIEEVAGNVQDAYTLVERLRPNWFRTRGVGSALMGTAEVVVYVNDAKRGNPETLRSVPLAGIREVRHLNGTDATQRFGLNHENGAILVTLR